MMPYGRQQVDDTDIQAVVDVLWSDWLTYRQIGPCFENAVAARCGAAQAVAVNSATSALHLRVLPSASAQATGSGPARFSLSPAATARSTAARSLAPLVVPSCPRWVRARHSVALEGTGGRILVDR